MAVRAYGDEVLSRVGLSFLSIRKRMQVVDLDDTWHTVDLRRVEPAYDTRRAPEFETFFLP